MDIDSFQKPTVRWYIGDVEILANRSGYSLVEEGNVYKLKMSQVKPEMSGTYTCKAENECGVSESSATFTVHSKPKFKKELSDQKLKEGDKLNLSVEIAGTPEPEVKWYKDGKEIPVDASAEAHIRITRDSKRKETYNLSVTLVKGSDGGNYEVRAKNDLGMITSKSKVVVLSKSEKFFYLGNSTR